MGTGAPTTLQVSGILAAARSVVRPCQAQSVVDLQRQARWLHAGHNAAPHVCCCKGPTPESQRPPAAKAPCQACGARAQPSSGSSKLVPALVTATLVTATGATAGATAGSSAALAAANFVVRLCW